MKLSKIYLELKENQEIEPAKSTPEPEQLQADPLRSNIDQFWMNTEDLKSDLYKFLERVQNKDPQLARYMRNTIRNVLAKFTYRAKPKPTSEPETSPEDI